MTAGATGLSNELQIRQLGVLFAAQIGPLTHHQEDVEIAQCPNDALRVFQPLSKESHVRPRLELFIGGHGLGHLLEVIQDRDFKSIAGHYHFTSAVTSTSQNLPSEE